MPIFTLGGAMIIGMGLGLAGNAALDSTVNTQKACDQINQANQNLQDMKKQYKQLLQNEALVKQSIEKYITTAKVHKRNTKILVGIMRDEFKQTQLRQNVSLGIFLFVLILFLLLKKFNVFGNIWNLFTKK